MTQALPRGWTSASLNTLGTWLGGGTPSKANPAYWQNGTVEWVSPKDMKRLLIDSAQDQITKKALKESATNLVPANSVLMVTRSGILAHTFPVGINTVDVAINQDLKAWTSLGAVSPTYAAYFLKARGQHILRECSKDGTTVSSIDFDRLSAYPVAVAPANEQRRVVSKIDELFSRIDEGEQALKRVEKLVERYRQSVLKAAVTGELTRGWREARKRAGESVESGEALFAHILKARRAAWERAELAKLKDKGNPPTDDRWKQRYTAPQPPNTTGLPELPEGWVWTSLDMIADVTGGITVDAKRSGSDCESVPYLRVANVQRGYLNLSEIKSLLAPKSRIDALKLRPGDILFNEGGDLDKLGRGWIWEGQIPVCIHQNHVFRARLVLPGPWPKLVSWYANEMGRAFFIDKGKQTTNLASISLTKLKALPVPMMSETEAAEIESRVSAALAAIEHHNSDIRSASVSASALRQSILKAAFSGQLVPQDPKDEPAAKLLERIAAGRMQATPAPRPRKKKTA